MVGGHGTGGEYDVQLGFGWTNGVILDLLHLYGSRLSSDENDFTSSLLLSPSEANQKEVSVAASSSSSGADSGLVLPLIITAFIFSGIFIGGSIW